MLTFLVLNSVCVCRAHHTQRKPLFILSVCFAQLFVCRRTATGCLSRPANLPVMTPRRRRKNLCESALFEGLLGEEQLHHWKIQLGLFTLAYPAEIHWWGGRKAPL